MQRISKGNPPAFFSDFIKKEKPKDWNDVAPIREKLREYILENEQKGFCAYTEIKIQEAKRITIFSLIRQLTLLLSIWNIPLQGRWKLLAKSKKASVQSVILT